MPPIIKAHDGFVPQIGEEVFLADGAVVVGHVQLGNRASVWYGAVVRADIGQVSIGEGTTVQDLACIHMRTKQSVDIGDFVSVGHGAIVHGAKVGHGAYIGNGAILMDRAEIGEEAVVSAGALVPRGMVVPPRTLVRGRPAKVVRELKDDEHDLGRKEAMRQIAIAKKADES